VPAPSFVLDELSVQCANKTPGDLVFGTDGGYLPRPKSATGWFQAAARKAKVQKITPHDLRHTCASLAVSAGVNVLALQRMLGHTSAKMTLDTYADLFDDDLDAVAVTPHARYSPKVCPKCAHRVPKRRRANMKTAIYLSKHHHGISAGGGIRTLTLSRAPAPKAGMSAVPSRPQAADRTG
jgi:hypothetical protein